MSIFAAIHQQVREARAEMREVVHMRVTDSALPGSLAAVPLTPERVRALKPYIVQIEGRDTPDAMSDPELTARGVEIILHPQDWSTLLTEAEAATSIEVGNPTRVWGIPVSHT